MSEFTKEQLNEMTVTDLRRMCVDKLGIPGMTKKRKDVIIDSILLSQEPDEQEALKGLAFQGQSSITKPEAKFGDKATTTIQVSCGANSAAFPIVGRTVSEVADLLREILNVDKLSTGLVNSKEVAGDYALKEGDVLEFLKPAGQKG